MKKVVISLLLLFTIAAYAHNEDKQRTVDGGILYSRIGYDLKQDKRVVIRNSSKDFLKDNSLFQIVNEKGKVVQSGKVKYWGKKWREHWWEINFTKLDQPGVYKCQVKLPNDKKLETGKFHVASKLLWNETWETVTFDQLRERVKLRVNNKEKHGPKHAEGGGWQDCGGYLRETNSHVTMLVGLFDLMEYAPERINEKQNKELVEQAIIGLDYIAFCQDKAKELGLGDGAVIHHWPKHTTIITGDIAKSALAFARGAFLLKKANPKKAKEYLQRAKRSFNWLDKHGIIHHTNGHNFHGVKEPDDGFDRWTHGAPENFVRVKEWMTRDLVMMAWTAVELYKAGDKDYKSFALSYAKRVMNRQISKKDNEGGFWGHFRTYSSATFSEKSFIHHSMAYDAGGTFPHYLIPFFEMLELWPAQKEAKLWKNTLTNFAYGYLKPACFDNPFYLLPVGYYAGEGLLNFSCLWHGMNGTYGSAAALALEFEKLTGDKDFKSIATGNLQWIAGLNSGVKEKGQYVSKSMIYGIGDVFMGSWTKIPGTICNGFDADAQFQRKKPKKETDGPNVFTDEGWITHSGGWLSALSRMNR